MQKQRNVAFEMDETKTTKRLEDNKEKSDTASGGDSAKPVGTTEPKTDSQKPNEVRMENYRLNKLIAEYLQPQKQRHNKGYSMIPTGCRCCAQVNLANRLKRLAQTSGGNDYQNQHQYARSLVPINHSNQSISLDQKAEDGGWHTKERSAVSRSLHSMEDSARSSTDGQIEYFKLEHWPSKLDSQSRQDRAQSTLHHEWTALDQSASKTDQLPAVVQSLDSSKDYRDRHNQRWQARLSNEDPASKTRQHQLPEMETDTWRYAALQAKKVQPGAVRTKRAGWPWQDEQDI